MAGLSSVYIKAETLETLLKTVKAKGDKGISITIATNDETRMYGQNVNAYVSQSKEDREAGKQKYFIGNGATFWTDGKMVLAEREQTNTSASVVSDAVVVEGNDDLPF